MAKINFTDKVTGGGAGTGELTAANVNEIKASCNALYDNIPSALETFVPANGVQLDKVNGRAYAQYTQTGVLAIVANDNEPLGCAVLKIVKTADAITVLAGETDITVIGKDPKSDDFDLTPGNVDRVVIWYDGATSDNQTGVYYSVTNLG